MIDVLHALFDSSCSRFARTLRFVSSDGDALNQAIQATEARCDFHKCTSRRSAISCEVHAKFKCWEAEPARPDGLSPAGPAQHSSAQPRLTPGAAVIHAKFKCWEAEPAQPDGLS